jgi:uncharacterized protein involved in exopolysaccharide biosynthesis
MESWKIRDEILRSVSQWYLILAMIIAGGLVGYLISYLVPSPYRATADIYVGIDVIRVNEMEHVIPLAEEEPLNLDDYKNWQLKQVADILTSSSVVGKTLNALKEGNSEWESISQSDLRDAMDIYWYDSGTWQMEITFPEKDLASTAVKTWIDTGHKTITDYLEISKSAAELDNQLWSVNTAIGRYKEKRASLKTFLSSGENWKTRLEDLDASSPLEENVLAEFNDWIRVYDEENSPWQVPKDGFPGSEQNAADYLIWLGEAISTAETALNEIQPAIDTLQSDREKILPDYHQSLEDSLGLSANLVLLPNTSEISVSPVHPTESLTLGGAFLGLMAWVLFAVFRIRNSREENA